MKGCGCLPVCIAPVALCWQSCIAQAFSQQAWQILQRSSHTMPSPHEGHLITSDMAAADLAPGFTICQ